MDSLAIGLAPFLMNSVSCFVVIFINRQLLKYGGDLSVGAYGIVNRYVFLFMMIVMGFTQGMQPIAGYNYGARQYDRVKEVLMRTIKWAMLIMTTSFVVGQLIPRTVVSAFTSDPDLIEKAAHGVRIIVLAFPVIGINLVTSNFFQSIGKPKRSIFLSLSRQLIFLTPLLYILPTFMGEKGVWWSFAISDIISTVVACLLLYQFFKTFNHEQTA